MRKVRMYLADKYGWPFEKRKGRPVHNFIRAGLLLARRELTIRRGTYISKDTVREKLSKQAVVEQLEASRDLRRRIEEKYGI